MNSSLQIVPIADLRKRAVNGGFLGYAISQKSLAGFFQVRGKLRLHFVFFSGIKREARGAG
ncbi:MAG TPA: hypothetical protein VFN26_09470 [Candidatus Acidoferrum sp.]|nr:hypothetical protein [Candidatus Acidoferrum sp.]